MWYGVVCSQDGCAVLALLSADVSGDQLSSCVAQDDITVVLQALTPEAPIVADAPAPTPTASGVLPSPLSPSLPASTYASLSIAATNSAVSGQRLLAECLKRMLERSPALASRARVACLAILRQLPPCGLPNRVRRLTVCQPSLQSLQQRRRGLLPWRPPQLRVR